MSSVFLIISFFRHSLTDVHAAQQKVCRAQKNVIVSLCVLRQTSALDEGHRLRHVGLSETVQST